MKNFAAFVLVFVSSAHPATAQVAATSSSPSPSPGASPGTPTENSIVVTSQALDESREQIVPSLGATRYTVGAARIDSQPEGENASFNQTILRFPGVAQDSFGQLHVRGEHANLQYRIDDVLLPESLAGFGQELQTRFADNVSLITGALPAQFGLRTTGVVDIHTKNGAVFDTTEASLYGGSYDTIMPSIEYGGTTGKWSYYVTASYLHNDLGIENPTSSRTAIHDDTNQYKLFGYFSYIFDETSRLTLLLSGDISTFQIPNNPGQTPVYNYEGKTTFNSARLDENQNEQSAFEILTYQKRADDLNFQVSIFNRYSSVLFLPDDVGDLIFNGVASRVDRGILSNGLEFDASYKLNNQHTIRGGFVFTEEHATDNTSTLVFPVDENGSQTSTTPERIVDNNGKYGYIYGFYLQDEWKPLDQLTINLGGRFDVVNAFANENQLSPRINVVYTPFVDTTLHAGYARYFTPPPLEGVAQATIDKFDGTTNEPAIRTNSPITSERASYFDAGVTQQITKGFNVGLDGYYKNSHSTLDEGQFGQALILSSFNYKLGDTYGGEFTASYDEGPISAYMNVACEWARGKHISSAQFLFDPDELNYIRNNYVFLDHDQRVTASAGVSYTWKDWKAAVDLLYGSGLRKGFANTQKNPSYETVGLNLQRRIKITEKTSMTVRFDVVNLFDKVYELRDGSGIGVGAPQFGQRRGFYGTLSYDF